MSSLIQAHVIPWMCRVLHEEPYQAHMDLGCIAVAVVILIMGWPIIVAHLRTLHREGETTLLAEEPALPATDKEPK
jgi:hypothetical protein